MTSRTVIVANALGLHARAAARFVHAATAFSAQVRVTSDGRTVDGKSIMGILLLAAARGTPLIITTEGDDEETALAALCALVEGGLGEEPCNA